MEPTVELPKALTEFCIENGIDESELRVSHKSLPRYIRVSPRNSEVVTADKLAAAFKTPVEPVDYLPGFFRLDGSVPIAGTPLYDDGLVFGMDVSSGVAVKVLQVEPGHDVLDLCSAPGAKLCMLSDLMDRRGTLCGVDVSRERAQVCVSLLLKYKVCGEADHTRDWHLRMVVGDGTTFDLRPRASAELYEGRAIEVVLDSHVQAALDPKHRGRKRKNKSTRRRDEIDLKRRRLAMELEAAARPELLEELGFYDRVLVDAECTHDGSLKHVAKFLEEPDRDVVAHFLNPARLASLAALQRGLISNGFRLLRPGGIMVYSTCSLSVAQNESVVAWLLASEPSALLVPVDEKEAGPCVGSKIMPGTVKFLPRTSQSGGLFIARLTKRES